MKPTLVSMQDQMATSRMSSDVARIRLVIYREFLSCLKRNAVLTCVIVGYSQVIETSESGNACKASTIWLSYRL